MQMYLNIFPGPCEGYEKNKASAFDTCSGMILCDKRTKFLKNYSQKAVLKTYICLQGGYRNFLFKIL